MEPEDDELRAHLVRDQHIPSDARRMGLSSSVPDGALLELAGSLDSSKLSHRVIAWVLLAAFVIPVLLTLLTIIG